MWTAITWPRIHKLWLWICWVLYRVTAIILDTAQYRLFRPVHNDLSTDAKTHFIKRNFINKGTDAVNLPSILRSKSVTETVPTYFEEKEPPMISYTHTKTIASKIFNFSSTLSGLDYHQFHKSPSQCECNTSSHLYQPYGHDCNHWWLFYHSKFYVERFDRKRPKIQRAMQSWLGQNFITFMWSCWPVCIAMGQMGNGRAFSSVILEGNGERLNWRMYFQAETEFQTTHRQFRCCKILTWKHVYLT